MAEALNTRPSGARSTRPTTRCPGGSASGARAETGAGKWRGVLGQFVDVGLVKAVPANATAEVLVSLPRAAPPEDKGGFHTLEMGLDPVFDEAAREHTVELERAIGDFPEIEGCAVVGRPDDRWGERPMLAVVASPGFEADAVAGEVTAAIQAAIDAGRFPKWALPERVEVLDELPKTSVGKLDKKRLRALYGIPTK